MKQKKWWRAQIPRGVSADSVCFCHRICHKICHFGGTEMKRMEKNRDQYRCISFGIFTEIVECTQVNPIEIRQKPISVIDSVYKVIEFQTSCDVSSIGLSASGLVCVTESRYFDQVHRKFSFGRDQPKQNETVRVCMITFGGVRIGRFNKFEKIKRDQKKKKNGSRTGHLSPRCGVWTSNGNAYFRPPSGAV